MPTKKVANVVSLSARKPMNASERAKLARLPAPVHQVQEKAKQLFQKALRTLFDNTDDALFELADRATNNNDQNIYFESMREVRIRRRELESKFATAMEDAFAILIKPQPASDSLYDDPSFSVDGLSLVGNEELEELVAVDSMISRANEACGESLQYLALRVDSLVPIKVYQKNNPVGPEVVCRSFVDTTADLEIDIKAKLVLFKLFDQYVVSTMPQIYDYLNQVLVEANVLPSLQHQRRAPQGHHPQRRASDVQSPAVGPDTGAPVGGQVYVDQGAATGYAPTAPNSGGQVGGGYAAQPHVQGAAPQGGVAGSGYNQSGVPQGAGLQDTGASQQAAGVLLGALTQIQSKQNVVGQPSNLAQRPVGLQEISSLLTNLMPGNGQVAEHQADSINLVRLLFEFILDDRNLANPMKALISRLQIPILKVAILDHSFFSKGGHPARRLLNEMATASLGWQEDPNAEKGAEPTDPLYRKIQQIVQRLLREFETDVGIFNELLADFVSFVEKERRRAELLEKRIIDAEAGKAKAEAARETVTQALADKVKGRQLPQEAATILNSAWSNVLFFICLKEGTDNSTWEEALVTAEDLIWSVSTPLDMSNRKTLLTMIPGLVKRLRVGLEKISFNPFELTKLLSSLEKLHIQRLKAHQDATLKARAEGVKETPAKTSPQSQSEQASKPVVDAVAKQPVAETPKVTKPVQEASKTAKLVAVKSTREQPVETSGEEAAVPVDANYLALVSTLTQGTWFEMADANKGHFRCRLAAIIKATDKYIFVNRGGMKVAEKTREELALALKSGDFRVLDDTMLFDRALESVIGGSRKNSRPF